MEWLNSLFFEHTPLQAVVILSIITAVGLGLGKIHVFGISLGVTFVFFAILIHTRKQQLIIVRLKRQLQLLSQTSLKMASLKLLITK